MGGHSENFRSLGPTGAEITAYSPPVLTPSINQLLMEGCHGGGPFSTASAVLPLEDESRDPPCGAGSLFVYGPDRWTVGCAVTFSNVMTAV